MSKGIIRTDNMKATVNGNIRSAKYMVSTTETAIENGMLVKVEELLSAATNREMYKAVKSDDVTDINIGVVASPELIYDEALKSTGALKNFENKAGQPITVLMLAKQDILSVNDACIDAVATVPVVGNYVTNEASNLKWEEKSSLGGTESVVGVIIAREKVTSEFAGQGADSYMNVIQINKAN